jgi:hypothetical protein
LLTWANRITSDRAWPPSSEGKIVCVAAGGFACHGFRLQAIALMVR